MGTIIEQHTYASFVHEARFRTKHKNCNDDYSRHGDHSFTQTHNFEEAVDYAIKGWDLGLEQYKIEDGVLADGSTIVSPSVAGCFPHIQNHIIGLPEQMYHLYDEREYNLPTLDIVVPFSYSGRVNSKNTLEFGKTLVAYINAMASNWNIRLSAVDATRYSDTRVFQIITLKDFDEPLVINNVAFTFHPSFLRRFQFSVAEGKEYWQDGYGTPIIDYKKVVKENMVGTKADKEMYFQSLNNVDSFTVNEKTVDSFLI